jgi:hypothetical protein
MDEDSKSILIGMFIVFVTILLFTLICWVGYYYCRNLTIQNFQNTIKDLSDEQKCLHICGFQFPDFLETYKFCIEKCDRISERTVQSCLKN